MDLSIIIVNYNTRQLLMDCLDSVLKTTKGISYEVIVVDNASVDDSLPVLRKRFPEVKIIANKDNSGFAKANNQGIAIAQGKYVLLLNSDTIVLQDCLKKTFEYAERNPKAGVIGCKVLNKDGSLQHSCYHHPNFLSELIFFTKGIIKDIWDPVTHWKYMKGWDHNDTRKVDSLSGCFFWVSRQVFDAIGMLDDKIFMYFEDAEFCRRVYKKSPYEILYYHEAQIIHLGGASSTTNELKVSTLRACFKASVYYMECCYGSWLARGFELLCRGIWQVEKSVFWVLRSKEQCQRKFMALEALLK